MFEVQVRISCSGGQRAKRIAVDMMVVLVVVWWCMCVLLVGYIVDVGLDICIKKMRFIVNVYQRLTQLSDI